jgi:hypothetical protein
MNLPARKEIIVIQSCPDKGRFLNPSLRSVESAISRVEADYGIGTEWVLAVSALSADTDEYLNNQLPARVEAVVRIAAQPAAEQINSIVKKSLARFVCIIGGEDLVSSNWLSLAYNSCLKGDDKEVFHPAMIVAFGADSHLFLTPDQADPDFTIDRLLARNPFPAICISARRTFEEIPFQSPNHQSGFGHFDWHWVCETTAHGLVHRPVAGTFACCRVPSEHSCLEHCRENNSLIQSSRLFNPFSPERARI